MASGVGCAPAVAEQSSMLAAPRGARGSVHDAIEPKFDLQLPRRCRLTHNEQFLTVFRRHRKFSDRHFRLLVHYRNDPFDARLGIIVSRRVSRRAVQRNRIKRQLREAFRQNRQKLNSVDLVVIADRSCESAANAELYRAFVNLLKKLKV